MSSAILLVAHGSRRPAANAELLKVAELLRPRVAPAVVEIAYLELTTPSIPEGLNLCLKHGVNSVRILPYFLSPGAHVVEDLERERADFATRFPEVEFTLCPPMGLHPLVIDVLQDRLSESLNSIR